MKNTKQAKKRPEAEIRNNHLKKGALLLKFTVDRIGINQDILRQWRSIEKKGFLVTKTGCLIPALNHKSNSKKKSAYEIAMNFFFGKSKNLEQGIVNEFGWPAEEQLSHLCHDNSCCCYKDLEIEPQWKNLKRNYCGFFGFCDCGMIPKCKCRYLPSNTIRNYDLLHYEDKNLSLIIKELFEYSSPDLTVKVSILPKDYYKVEDEKRVNRNTRIKRKRIHDAEHLKNKKRKLVK